jgi:NADH-quinone oxidoreductase subunit C
MGLTREETHNTIKEQFSDSVVREELGGPDPFLVIRGDALEAIAYFCRDDGRLEFDLLSCISGVDYPDRNVIEVVYCLDSTSLGHRLILKVELPRDEPTVATVESVWRTADWHERETFDLVGVDFAGHHNLVRILCAEDWEGHPLRKDYVIPETYHGIKNVIY